MAINVAGTNALGDYLASEIANARTLIGGATSNASSSPIGAALAAEMAVPQQPLSPTQLQSQASADNLANMQMLFGDQSAADVNWAPAIPGETALQSSQFAAQFATVATLFGSNGVGANTDVQA
jgi:hypothetical protein